LDKGQIFRFRAAAMQKGPLCGCAAQILPLMTRFCRLKAGFSAAGMPVA